jgi:hypothetical protein
MHQTPKIAGVFSPPDAQNIAPKIQLTMKDFESLRLKRSGPGKSVSGQLAKEQN